MRKESQDSPLILDARSHWGRCELLANADQTTLVASLILRLVKKHDNDAEFGEWSGNTATVDSGSQQGERHDSGASGCQPSLMLRPWPNPESVSQEPAKS